ncbi:9996_t:CDS:2 [Diversispora eburnea]|uniref:9996_t:CDS:1 n=2 Tax=Diversisporales TaxID=214509 RepID=A0A9N8VV55_9GLOM|nr:9996_t:CDS:2 [Diversispora eburnea]
MDHSAKLLSILHKNPTSESTKMVGQISPTTSSYPSSQQTPPPRQGSPNPMPAFSFNHAFTQPTGTLNPQPISHSSAPPISGVGALSPQNGEIENLSKYGATDPTLYIDKASTESLKLALFGPTSTVSKAEESRQENEIRYQPETSMAPDDGPENEEDAPFVVEETSEVDEQLASPVDVVDVIDYDKLISLDNLESIKPSITTISTITSTTTTNNSKDSSSTTTNKPVFTYSNPFDFLKSPPPSPSNPNRDQVVHQWPSRSSSPTQKKREVPTMQKDGAAFYRSLQQIEPFLPEFSAWNIRANSAPKSQSSVPDGVSLPMGTLLYDTGERNENVLSSNELDFTTITLKHSELEYRTGKSIAVNGHFICYAVKGGKIRVIDTEFGAKTLLRNHEKTILDMCIQETAPNGNEEAQMGRQLLLAVGADSKITVWELFQPPTEPEAEIPYKVLLEIDAKEMQDSKQPRYHRATWHPVNPNLFAVATDTNEVLIFDISKILEDKDQANIKESEINDKILKSEIQEKPINDLTFSPDGTTLATANDELVIFWTLNYTNESTEIKHSNKINLDGQVASSILFVDREEISKEQPFKVRYVVIGTERNNNLHLYDVESSEFIQSIKFLPPPERRSSITKSNAKEESIFNIVSFDQMTRTLIVANSARISIFALHLNMSSKKVEKLDSYDQNNFMTSGQTEYESMSSFDDLTAENNSMQFDYMVEFPANQLIGSFTVVPGANPSDGFSLYCIQSKAIQQCIIPGNLLYPPNIESCPEYVSAELATRHRQEPEDDIKKEDINRIFTETLDFSSQAENLNQSSTEEIIIEKDIEKESVESVIVEGDNNSEINVVTNNESEEILVEKINTISDPLTGNMQESTFIIEETENKGTENNRNLSNIKLSGPIVNGTIAKLKEKRKDKSNASPTTILGVDLSSDSEKTNRKKDGRRGLEKEKDNSNENVFHSPEASNRSAGKKSAEGISKNNGKFGTGNDKIRKPNDDNGGTKVSGKINSMTKQQTEFTTQDPSQTFTSSGLPPAQMQTILKEIRKMEDNVTNKLGKTFSKELEKQFQKIEDERVAHQAAETSRQETILKMVSQTLSTNTSKLLETTIRNEIQNSVLPTLSKMVTNAVDKHAHRGMVDAVNKSIPTAIEKSVADNVQRVLAKTPVIESIAKGVSRAIRPVIEETFRENFTNVLIPSYQKATNAMFEQITTTFEAGMQDIAVKSAQASSYNNANGGDQSTLIRLQASVDHLALNVQQLQQLYQLQTNLSRQTGGQQPEPQLGRTSDEYPF